MVLLYHFYRYSQPPIRALYLFKSALGSTGGLMSPGRKENYEKEHKIDKKVCGFIFGCAHEYRWLCGGGV